MQMRGFLTLRNNRAGLRGAETLGTGRRVGGGGAAGCCIHREGSVGRGVSQVTVSGLEEVVLGSELG